MKSSAALAKLAAEVAQGCDRARKRMPPKLYLEVKAQLLAVDPDAQKMIDWALNIERPATPEHFAQEVIWIILCAGRSAQAARTIQTKVWAAINAGRPAVEGFGYHAKAAAIDRAWRDREADFAAFQKALAGGDGLELIGFFLSIPFVGSTTAYQLAKNCRVPVAKPDIWMARLAGIPDKPLRPIEYRFPVCQALCLAIEEATGDSVPVVDSVLWLASNKGVLRVGADAGPITIRPVAPRRRSIFESAPLAENS